MFGWSEFASYNRSCPIDNIPMNCMTGFSENEFTPGDFFVPINSGVAPPRHGIFATYLRIFGQVCTGMYRSVFRSSGIGGPTTAASSSAREQGLKNLNFNCLPRLDGLRIRRKCIVMWEIVGSTTTILERHYKKNIRLNDRKICSIFRSKQISN